MPGICIWKTILKKNDKHVQNSKILNSSLHITWNYTPSNITQRITKTNDKLTVNRTNGKLSTHLKGSTNGESNSHAFGKSYSPKIQELPYTDIWNTKRYSISLLFADLFEV